MEFDEFQQRVLSGDIGARRIVVAGPGAGKTATSVGLIQKLDSEIDPDSGDQIVFVSFSRAAVRAAFDAFATGDNDYRSEVAAMTLDSLAWQIADDPSGDSGSVPPDFDGRIRAATRQLRDRYDGELDHVVHLIVDEAQDLSAVRRELLLTIIDALPATSGVTIFGDPLQSIYDFLDEETIGDEVSAWDALVEALAQRSIGETFFLENNYRAQRQSARDVVRAERLLRGADSATRTVLLDELVSDLTHVDLDELTQRLSTWKGSTAVLARTNADVVWLFDVLGRTGLPCTWLSPGRKRSVAPWVAELWQFTSGKPFTRDIFNEFVSQRDSLVDGVFRSIVHATDAGSFVDWRSLARVLSRGIDPIEPWFNAEDADSVAVSTVHQSKGLEFDNVVVDGSSAMLRPAKGTPENELLLVALSRGRQKVVVLNQQTPFIRKLPGAGLYYRPHPRTQKAMAVAIEPHHLQSERPVGGEGGQKALRIRRRSHPVTFERLSTGGAEWPAYRCLIDGHAVGSTTEEFGRNFARVIGRSGQTNGWPDLGSVLLEGTETCWTTTQDTSFWIKPRPLGFAAVEWKKED
ncbi:UvrD-helicase domain-containing protein [Nocardia rosealba]|uniref:UvrD-helicase domain-containing protein n=1 Tax=Nocardia rosealba TaxID=2878563 RepID=UPI001CD9A647|nr:AAA family ATPase [Nocardia rosealba]MCA2206677.1 AAA family ATPase [Nocardia rosealba]